MAQRSIRFYRQNEAEVMQRFGLIPTKNSGAGWVEKEDGQNENVIAQLKSTDAQSISLKLKDIQILEYNASVAHKLPVFMIQFIGTGDVFFLARPCDFPSLAKYIDCGVVEINTTQYIADEVEQKAKPKIKSSSKARQGFWDEKRKEYGNGKKTR